MANGVTRLNGSYGKAKYNPYMAAAKKALKGKKRNPLSAYNQKVNKKPGQNFGSSWGQ